MKQLTCFLFLLLGSLSLSAQSWAPVGATWNYNRHIAFVPEVGHNTYSAVSDTVINGRVCKRLNYLHQTCNSRPDREYMYEDNGQVYYYNPAINDFHLLYDFNVPVGSTYKIPVLYGHQLPPYDSLLVRVDSSYTLSINGQQRNVQVVGRAFLPDLLYFNPEEIIAGIGSTSRMFNWTNGGACDDPYDWGLRCYEDSNLGFYSTGIADSCEGNLVVSSPLPIDIDATWQVYPNPTGSAETLHWQFHESGRYRVKIRDLQGTVVLDEQTAMKKISLKGLAPGMYLVEIRSPQHQAHLQKICKSGW